MASAIQPEAYNDLAHRRGLLDLRALHREQTRMRGLWQDVKVCSNENRRLFLRVH